MKHENWRYSKPNSGKDTGLRIAISQWVGIPWSDRGMRGYMFFYATDKTELHITQLQRALSNYRTTGSPQISHPSRVRRYVERRDVVRAVLSVRLPVQREIESIMWGRETGERNECREDSAPKKALSAYKDVCTGFSISLLISFPRTSATRILH